MLSDNVKTPELMSNREIGLQALVDALGPNGMIDFVMEGSLGSGDYTKEKQNKEPQSMDELEEQLKRLRQNS